MSDTGGFGEQLFQRLQAKGLSKGQVYKAITLQKLNDEVRELGAQGLLTESKMLDIARIESQARQKQLAEISVEKSLSGTWVKQLSMLIRRAEKAKTDDEANPVWDFYFEVKEKIEEDGPTRNLLSKVKDFAKQTKIRVKPSLEEDDEPEAPKQVKATPTAQEGAVTKFESAPDRKVHDLKKFSLQLGRGLDVGTTNICCSVEKTDGDILYNIQRNAFLDVRSDAFTKKMLMKLGIDHIVQGDKGFVVGDAAFELANIFEKNTRRPMKDGMISPLEPEAMQMVSLIISQLVNTPGEVGEICAFSIPSDPIDKERNVIYHTGALEAVLRKLGFTPKPMLEGHSVVFAELADELYTGIGISCGGGMFNVSIAYRSVPALTFSTSRGGDWVDNNVADALGMTASAVCAIKEGGVDIQNPKDRIEDAISIYYRNLIKYTLEQIRDKFTGSQNMPVFKEPISMVCAGGTSMIKGFIDVFREESGRVEFPVEVKDIRLAADPLRTVSRGCLSAAREETRAIKEQDLPTRDTVHVGRADIEKSTDIHKQTRRLRKKKKVDQSQEEQVVGKIQRPKTSRPIDDTPEENVVGKMDLPEKQEPGIKPTEGEVVGNIARADAGQPVGLNPAEGEVAGRIKLPDVKKQTGDDPDHVESAGRVADASPGDDPDPSIATAPDHEESVGKVGSLDPGKSMEKGSLDGVEELDELEEMEEVEEIEELDELEEVDMEEIDDSDKVHSPRDEDDDGDRPDLPLIS